METTKSYERFPARTVLLSNLLTFSVYALGCYVLSRISIIVSLLYLVYVAVLEFRLIRNHCTNCYYYGKTCGFGKGRLSALFFPKGDPSRFCINGFQWKDLLPDLLVSLIPLVTGIVLLIIHFNLILLVALLLIVFLSTTGNSIIRGKLTCPHCMQRELGCPAEQLFNKGKETTQNRQ